MRTAQRCKQKEFKVSINAFISNDLFNSANYVARSQNRGAHRAKHLSPASLQSPMCCESPYQALITIYQHIQTY